MRRRQRRSRATRWMGLLLTSNGHLRAAAKNYQVRVYQSLVRFLALLLLTLCLKGLLAAQWRKLCNETTGLHETVNVNVHWFTDRSVSAADHHLSRNNENRIAKMPGTI